MILKTFYLHSVFDYAAIYEVIRTRMSLNLRLILCDTVEMSQAQVKTKRPQMHDEMHEQSRLMNKRSYRPYIQ